MGVSCTHRQEGFTGSDSSTYTLEDGNEVPNAPAMNNGLVTLTVSNMLWFIDNGSMAATSDGRMNAPFRTLLDFNMSVRPQAGHIVFIEHTGTNYTGGIVLKDNQTLWGTGDTGTTAAGENLSTILPLMLAAHSFMLLPIDGTRPVITNTNAG